MGKGAILKGRNKENIYPVTASDLVFDPVSKKNVKAELSEKVEEAPMDGNTFVRKNGTWVNASNIMAESVIVSLSTNQVSQDDLNNALVEVSYDGAAVESYQWHGEPIILSINSGTVYEVRFPDIEGYKTPEKKVFMATAGLNRNIEAVYQTELLKVNVSAVGGSISGCEVDIVEKVKVDGVPESYTPIEYIESIGTDAYISFDYYPSNTTRVVIDMKIEGGTRPPVIGCNTGSSPAFDLWFDKSSSVSYLKYYIGTKTGQYAYSGWNSRHVYTMDSSSVKIDDSVNIPVDGVGTFSTSYKLKLAYRAGEEFTGKIYSSQVYNDNTIIFDLIPVVNPEGVAGLYDKVNGVFYPSLGDAAFVAGPSLDKVIAKQTTLTGAYKIPFGTRYTVSAINIDGYTTPSMQKFTASQAERNVDFVYAESNLGVFIQDIEGNLYTADKWDSSKTPNGIAILAENCQFVMALEAMTMLAWEDGLQEPLVEGIVTTTDFNTAISDFNGESNTQLIMNALSSDNAAKKCNSYIFPNGKRGYLGAAGEVWTAALCNESGAVEAAYQACGYEMGYYSLSSTQVDRIKVWLFDLLTREYYQASKVEKYNDAIPLAPYIANPKFITFTIEGTEYKCLEGTTWEEWCGSAFNSIGAYIKKNPTSEHYIVYNSNGSSTLTKSNNPNAGFYADSIIVEGTGYYWEK